MEEENKPKEVVKKIYTAADMHALHAKDQYTAFGPMTLSIHNSEPLIGFGRGTRNQREKVYQTKENMKAFLGSCRA